MAESGRPSITPDRRKRRLTVTISPEVEKLIRTVAVEMVGISRSMIVERAIVAGLPAVVAEYRKHRDRAAKIIS